MTKNTDGSDHAFHGPVPYRAAMAMQRLEIEVPVIRATTDGPSLEELTLMTTAFAPRLAEGDLFHLLEYLNRLTDHRFTGVYRFEPGWVVSVALWDRENPRIRIGADVKMKESYCWLTGMGGASYVIEDACADSRLAGHAAREAVRAYIAVLLRDKSGDPWGTLCHFDFQPRAVKLQTKARLERFRPLIEEMFVRDDRARWEPDADSNRRCFSIDRPSASKGVEGSESSTTQFLS